MEVEVSGPNQMKTDAAEQQRRKLRLELTAEEREWALDVKDMIDMTPECDSVTDFCCVHLALLVKDDVGNAVRRAIQLQEFRQNYDIRDTPQQGRQLIEQYMAMFPGQLLSLGLERKVSEMVRSSQVDPANGGPPNGEELGKVVFVHDCSKFDSTLVDTEKKLKIVAGASYYMHQALFMDCEAVRRGVMVLVECENFSFAKKQDLKFLSRIFSELVVAYPTKGSTLHFRTGVLANIMASLLRKFLSPDQRDAFRAGCQSDGGSFDKLYLTPDLETASRRVLDSFTEFLERRYETEKKFTLSCQEEDEMMQLEDFSDDLEEEMT